MKQVHAGPTEGQSSASRPDEWLTRREVAARLKKTARTIDTYIRAGPLPAVGIGGSILLRWSAVEKSLIGNYRIVPERQASFSEGLSPQSKELRDSKRPRSARKHPR